tara:strand:+ start:29375 stop:29680 length:306 start_codon:yes stop_codon:yes gene_type:complete
MERATKTYKSWTNRQKLTFHYFNPNGLYERMKNVREWIETLCEAGRLPESFEYTYTFLNETEMMNELWGKKRIETVSLNTLINVCERRIALVTKAVNEKLN